MRTQPEYIIGQLEIHNSRLNKEAILESAMEEELDEFFHGLRLALDKLVTFGVKEIPLKETDDGQGLAWDNFLKLTDLLVSRHATGHTARDAILLAMEVSSKSQWNDWYRRILIKDLRCGVSEKTVNKVAKKMKRPEYQVPVFECMLAQDSNNHERHLEGVKRLEPKLDGVRCLTIIDPASGKVEQYTRNGKLLENFSHITQALQPYVTEIGRGWVLDGEVVSSDFQTLMRQVHRKKDVQAEDARLMLFDAVPLPEFKAGQSVMGLRKRRVMLKELCAMLEDVDCIGLIEQSRVDLDTLEGKVEMEDYLENAVAQGYEGIMIKDDDSLYECKRSTAWLKQKPYIEVSLKVIEVEEGTGRNAGRLGAVVCEGIDDGKDIRVNVGSGFTDTDRDEYWDCRDAVVGQVVEVRADAITQNQDGTYSLRFPRFLKFRGFTRGEKI